MPCTAFSRFLRKHAGNENGTAAAQEHARRTIRHKLEESLREAARAGMDAKKVRDIFDLAASDIVRMEGQHA